MLEILAILAVYELILMGAILCGSFIFLIIVKTAYNTSFKEAYAFLNEGKTPTSKRKRNKRTNNN